MSSTSAALRHRFKSASVTRNLIIAVFASRVGRFIGSECGHSVVVCQSQATCNPQVCRDLPECAREVERRFGVPPHERVLHADGMVMLHAASLAASDALLAFATGRNMRA